MKKVEYFVTDDGTPFEKEDEALVHESLSKTKWVAVQMKEDKLICGVSPKIENPKEAVLKLFPECMHPYLNVREVIANFDTIDCMIMYDEGDAAERGALRAKASIVGTDFKRIELNNYDYSSYMLDSMCRYFSNY